MKRFHVHVGVSDLDRSIAFYSTLFGTAPTTVRSDYAKWMLDDPRVNFAISSEHHARQGVEHLGIQAEDAGELSAIYRNLDAAGRPLLEEKATTCCYAKSDKKWVSDPDGVAWETFLTHGEATHYGDSPDLAAVSASVGAGQCCAPAQPAAQGDGQCEAGRKADA